VLAGACLAAALLCLNAALTVMPIANAIAIFFVEPLILTVLSAVILKEKIGWRRIAAVVVGLIGAMIVIRPNWEEFGPTAALPLGTAVFFAFYVLINRIMTLGGKRLALQFWTGVASVAVIGVACLWGNSAGVGTLALSMPGIEATWLFLGMGALAVITHQMILLSLSMIPASVLAPMQYVEIVGAVLFGWWVFGDFPDGLTWVGTAIIILSGIYVFHRERRVAGDTA
jgi:drug/metabolite transporter (DMT)-like permease